ncbi:uncharacterized protein LOC125720464 isoform X2 [Brienomyrus brachyistius]|nr:uncharacterized protein LOC125720464 isoform X2 [Brienomyrus brachyistius]
MVAWLQLLLTLVFCVPDALGANGAIEAHTGETVTLRCDGRTLKDTEKLQWMLDGQLVSSYENGTFRETEHHINRTRLRSIQQNNFSLDIINVTDKDAGDYTCRISEEPEDIQSIRLIVNDIKNHTQQRAAGTQQGDIKNHTQQRAAETQQGDIKNHTQQRAAETQQGDIKNHTQQRAAETQQGGVSAGGSRVDTVRNVVPAVLPPAVVVPLLVVPLLVVFVVLIFICWKRQTAKRQGYSPPCTELASITEPPPA